MQSRQGNADLLTYRFFGRRMNPKANDSWSPSRRESKHVGEVGIKRDRHTTALDREVSHLFVRRAAQPNFNYSDRIHASQRDSRPAQAKTLREEAYWSVPARCWRVICG